MRRLSRGILFLLALLLVSACEGGGGPITPDDPTPPAPSVPTVTGRVINTANGDPVAAAEVSIGAATATTGPDGRFELTDLSAGPATLRCIAAGFGDFEADITVPSGSMTRDIQLTRIELLPPLEIAADIGGADVSIWISQAGQSVPSAVVTVNGVAIPRTRTEGLYLRALPEPVPAGSPLLLEVKAGGVTVEATGTVPEAPVLTSPVTGTVFASTDSIPVTWTSSADPNGFVVSLGSVFPALFQTPGTARDLRVAARDVGLMNGSIRITAWSEGSFTGPVHPDSRMNISSDSPYVAITIVAPPMVPLEGRIAFASTREGASAPHVYTFGAGDTEPTRIAFGEGPAWSPDGRMIAFTTWPGGIRDAAPSEVHVIEADGSAQRVVVGSGATHPAWSPDGARIVFARDGDIFVVNADGSGEAPLLRKERVRAELQWENPEVELSRPTWSPDGQRVAFIGRGFVLMADANGSNPRWLDVNDGMAGGTLGRAAWSPDGSRLAMGMSGGMDPVPWLVSAASDGTRWRVYEWGRGPDWSPDGTKLVYYRGADSADPLPTCCERIYLADLVTNRFPSTPIVPPAVNPANPRYSDYDPAWSRARE